MRLQIQGVTHITCRQLDRYAVLIVRLIHIVGNQQVGGRNLATLWSLSTETGTRRQITSSCISHDIAFYPYIGLGNGSVILGHSLCHAVRILAAALIFGHIRLRRLLCRSAYHVKALHFPSGRERLIAGVTESYHHATAHELCRNIHGFVHESKAAPKSAFIIGQRSPCGGVRISSIVLADEQGIVRVDVAALVIDSHVDRHIGCLYLRQVDSRADEVSHACLVLFRTVIVEILITSHHGTLVIVVPFKVSRRRYRSESG